MGISSISALADPSGGIKASSKFGTLYIDRSEYYITHINGTSVKVSGTVSNLYSGDNKITIVLTMPHGSTKESQILANSDGTFQTSLPLESNSQNGTYSVSSSYAGTTMVAITFVVKLASVSVSNMPVKIQTNQTSQDYTSTNIKIPKWIKNNAKLWHDGSINDNDFEKGIQYLINQKIIKISETQQRSQSIQRVPTWVKNLAEMWTNGNASDDDFTKAIEYMVNVGIIPINVSSTQINMQNATTPVPTTPAPIKPVSTASNSTINANPNSLISSNPTTLSNNLPTLLGSGINLKIINNTASGFLTLNGKHYTAPNLTMVIKDDKITLTGYVQGSFNVLLMTTGIRTSDIEYQFNGAITNNDQSEPIAFTALLTNPAGQPTTITTPLQNIRSTTAPQQVSTLPMLMLTTQNDRVYMAYQYNFVVKIFEPQSNPQKIFDQFNGGISDVNITTTILDPDNKIIGQSTGKTDSKGTYQDGITMPYTGYSQEQLQVLINATKKGYATQIATLPLLLIHPQGGSAPVCSVSTSSLQDGKVGIAYSQTLSSSNCQSPVTWSLSSGALPPGLTLSSGVISGTPTTLNSPITTPYSFVVKVTSSDGRVATASLSISIPS